MSYTTYNPKTGRVMAIVTDRSLAPGVPAIPGTWNASTYYIKGNVPKLLPPIMGNPNNYDWDFATESWVFNPDKAKNTIRRIRDKLLTAVDRVNPLWYASLSAERQAEIQDYRQALLDVTDQPGFPASVTWPAKPGWL